jgi:microcystin-dependent protein
MRNFLCFLLLTLTASLVQSQSVPTLTNYQGRITDANGSAVPDGNSYEIEVRLWSSATGGTTPIWATRYTDVMVKNGALNLILGGGGSPITGAITTDLKTAFATSSVYLGMTVTKGATGTPIANPSEILPRQQWMTAPFAFRAESVTDGSIEKIDLSAALRSELSQLVPSGTVIAFAGPIVPPGWLKCDGANVSRTQYSSLFAAIGTAHGSGDGSSTFSLPDYRGIFLRGVNENRMMPDGVTPRDPDNLSRLAGAPGGATGNAVGSVQDDTFKSHAHKTDGTDQGSQHPSRQGNDGSIDFYSAHANSNDAEYMTGSKTGLSGGSETRPKNAYVLYIIKI